MIHVVEGRWESGHRRFAVVVSKVHNEVTELLLQGALDFLTAHGVEDSAVLIVKVPGAWEIPIVVDRLARSHGIDAVICLGAVVRDQTAHYDYLAVEVSKAVAGSSRTSGKPIGFGVLLTDTLAQAEVLAGKGEKNKGWEAARSAMETADLLVRIGEVEGSGYLQRLH